MGANELRKNRKPKPVTLIVGIACRNAIVIGADSRTSSESGCRDDTKKINILTFKNGHAIMAVAGSADMGALLTAKMQDAALGEEIKDHRSIGEFFENILRRFKADQAKAYSCQLKKLVDTYMLRGVSFSALVAYYFKRQPYLYTADTPLLAATPQDYSCLCLGCGSDVGKYLLRGLDVSTFKSHQTVLTTVNIIREIKLTDNRCGGPTQITILGNGDSDKPEILSQQTVEAMECRLAALSESHVQERERQTQEIINSTSLGYQSFGLPPGPNLEDLG